MTSKLSHGAAQRQMLVKKSLTPRTALLLSRVAIMEMYIRNGISSAAAEGYSRPCNKYIAQSFP